MRVVLAREEVADLIRARGGRLYVWTDTHHCCSGSTTLLRTGPAPADGRQFDRFASEGFELWFDPGSLAPPDELHLDVKGLRRKRVEAYWNGCAFAI